MDINKLGSLLDGYLPFSNIKEDCTVFIGEFIGYPYMIPISYDSIKVFNVNNTKDKLARVSDEYMNICNDKNFYVVNIGGSVYSADIDNKLILSTMSSYEENKYKYSILIENEIKYLAVSKEQEQVLKLSLENKTIKYLVEEINRNVDTKAIDFYATTNIGLDVNANTLPIATDCNFTQVADDGYMSKLDNIFVKLSNTEVKHIGIVDGEFLKPYLEDGKRKYKYQDLRMFADFMAESGNHITMTIPYSNTNLSSKTFEDIINDQTLTFHDAYTSDEVGGILTPFVNVLVSDISTADNNGTAYTTNCVPLYVGLLKNASEQNHCIKSFIEMKATSNISIPDDVIITLSNKGFIPMTCDKFNINIHGNKNLIYEEYKSNDYSLFGSENITKLMSFNQNVLLVQDILRDLTKHFDGYFETASSTIFNRHPIGAESEIKKQAIDIIHRYKNSIMDYNITVEHYLENNSYSVVNYKIAIEIFIAGEVNSLALSTVVM